jgi:hypothetical protein
VFAGGDVVRGGDYRVYDQSADGMEVFLIDRYLGAAGELDKGKMIDIPFRETRWK